MQAKHKIPGKQLFSLSPTLLRLLSHMRCSQSLRRNQRLLFSNITLNVLPLYRLILFPNPDTKCLRRHIKSVLPIPNFNAIIRVQTRFKSRPLSACVVEQVCAL